MQNSAEKALREPQESFAALAAAVHPTWHHAILGLAYQCEKVNDRLDKLYGPSPGPMVPRVRRLITDLVDFLDSLETDPDLEPSCGVAYGYPPGADECEPPEDAEPSLGSLDRIMDQARAWRCGSFFTDVEQDDCDSEDDDPNEAKQQAPEMCPCA